MILRYFYKFFAYFRDEKRFFLNFAFLSLIAGLLELFGVALTYPFVLKIILNSKSEESITVLLIGIGIVLLFLIKNVFMIFYTYLQTRYTNQFESKIKIKFMEYFLTSQYQNAAQIPFALKNKIFSYLIPTVTNNYIFRLLNLCVNLVIFTLITVLLAVKFPVAAFCAIICILILLKTQDFVYKPLVKKASEKVNALSLKTHQAFNEILIDLKSIKVSNNEKYFYNRFKSTTNDYHENYSGMSFLNIVPPYVTEPFIIIMLFIFLAIISFQSLSSPEKLVASFALIVSAIFRLAPAISRLQVNINGINSALPAVKEFLFIYDKYKIENSRPLSDKVFQTFNQYIELKGINFGYNENPVLKNINLTIKKGDFIGIAGLSGAGKTTLADVIAGLYKPNGGEIIIDGMPKVSDLKIGYIPQEFTLISGNIRENVAFGSDIIDDERVIKALKQAQLYDFIEENYSNGIYEAPFADSSGISQGQKQRLAIARALYFEPDILIMDEGTSSLDLITEDKICDTLENLKGNKTIIVIAHRLSTIKSADKIIFIKDGEITGNASFEELIKTNSDFEELVRLSDISKSN